MAPQKSFSGGGNEQRLVFRNRVDQPMGGFSGLSEGLPEFSNNIREQTDRRVTGMQLQMRGMPRSPRMITTRYQPGQAGRKAFTNDVVQAGRDQRTVKLSADPPRPVPAEPVLTPAQQLKKSFDELDRFREKQNKESDAALQRRFKEIDDAAKLRQEQALVREQEAADSQAKYDLEWAQREYAYNQVRLKSQMQTFSTEMDNGEYGRAESAIDVMEKIYKASEANQDVVTVVIEGLRTAVAMRREAQEAATKIVNDALKAMDERIAVMQQNGERDEALVPRVASVEGFVGTVTRTRGAMERSLGVGSMRLSELRQARTTLAFQADRPRGDPARRIGWVRSFKPLLGQLNYDVANIKLGQAMQRLDKIEKVVRVAAQYLPGGDLGLAIAHVRSNPDDPDNTRTLLRGVALSSVDLIPVPGLRRVTKKAGPLVAGRYKAQVQKTEKEVIRKADTDVNGPVQNPDPKPGITDLLP